VITIRWWVLALLIVLLVSGVWSAAKYLRPPTVWAPPLPGPAAADPYGHDLHIAEAINAGCSQSCPVGAAELAGVSWHLRTSNPPVSSSPAQLEGRVCQTGTWGTPAEMCTEPFEIKEGEIDSPQRLVIFAKAPPPGSPPEVYSVLYIELMVGAKRSYPLQKPAMESRATAAFNVVVPLQP
jgi:hypothetical protein